MTTVMQAIRTYSAGEKLISPKIEIREPVAHAPELYDVEEPYLAHIRSLLAQEDFAGLDAEIRQVRQSQARVQGGSWKVFLFYFALTTPPTGTEFSDDDWRERVAETKKWIAARPDSAAARIALAETYAGFGWAARGGGYADTVSNSGWKRFHERIAFAESALMDAASVKEKCPYWYEAMLHIAVAQGWDKQQTRELFNQATTYAPNYYHMYREYANYLLPKWYGEEGEMQSFAEEAASRMSEPDASILYFELASLLACQCDNGRNTLDGMSWPRIKAGYAELEHLYGTTKLKSNRFAYMSYLAKDKASAQAPFTQLGDDWEGTVWQTVGNYQIAKKWAFSD